MRLALLTPGFSADERDWCIPALAHLVRQLAARHEVHVYALRYPPRRASHDAFAARVHALGGGAGALGRLALLARAFARLRRDARRSPFALVHGMWADEAGFLAVAAGRALGVPAAVSLLGGELVGLRDISYGTWLSPAGRALVRRALARADAVTVGSQSLARLASPLVAPERLHRLPLGVDTRLFHAGNGRETAVTLAGDPCLLHVASLVPVKDQAMLLRAFARVVAELPAARLHLVGDGPLRGALEALAGALDLGPRVAFHGAVRHERLPDYYRAADLCVISSRFESQCMAALEAGACGRVTVGTAVGVVPELPGGRPVAVGDPAALAVAVVELARDPARRTAAEEACRAEVAARFSLESAAGALADLYRSLLAGGRREADEAAA